MLSTIAVSEDVKRELHKLKIEEGFRSFNELIKKLIVEYKKIRFMEASKLFRERLKEKKLRLEDIL